MTEYRQVKIVIFGAGKIGRSFIGQLFGLGGYEVVFIDLNQQIIAELNKRKNYNIIIKSDIDEVINITNVRGVYALDETSVAREVATAGIVAVSVGLNGLNHVFPSLVKGLIERLETGKTPPLDIIIAENMRDADAYFRHMMSKLLPPSYPFDSLVGLVETSIGKMVPIMLNKDLEDDILQVFAEPYNTLILDKKAFKNPIPQISGLSPKENMKAWVDRKLFIHNLGHAAAAYIGHLHNPEFVYMYEALSVPLIMEQVRDAMLQSAGILLRKYPDEFTQEDLTNHIDDLLMRFRNKALGDTIFRVGCDLLRKLGPEDRLAGAIKEAIELNMPFDKILYALACGCQFRATDENGKMHDKDAIFLSAGEKGTDQVLAEVCGFNETLNTNLFEEARTIDRFLKTMTTTRL